MDFTRGGQARTNNIAPNAEGGTLGTTASVGSTRTPSRLTGNNRDKHNKLIRIGFLVLLFSGTILAVATLLFLAFGKSTYRESKFVNNKQLQAVFINVNGTNGGQVYFGNIQELTPQYIHLSNVFYIQNQQAGAQSEAQASSSYNLVKLGCELHGPEDAMFINRSEVFFWENLKPDSQVAQKVAEFRKQNPDGQKCTDASNQTQQPGGAQPPAATPPAAKPITNVAPPAGAGNGSNRSTTGQ